jgi:hypothetical protein
MATSKKTSNRIHSPEGIASYVNLFQPRQRTDAKGNPQGDPKYGLALFFDEDTNLKEMKAAAQKVGIEKFGPKFTELVKKGKINWPFTDTEDMDDPQPPFDQPGVVVNFKTTDKPGIVDADAEPIMDKSEVYSGMRARVSCRPFAYDNASKGVAFALINVQKLGDGERLSGNPSAEDDFGDSKSSGTSSKKAKSKSTDDDDDLL